MKNKKWCQFFMGMICTACLMTGCGAANKAYDKALELMGSGKYDEAAEYFDRAIEKNNEKAEYYIGYGMNYNYQGQYDEALEEFDKAYQDVDNDISRKNNKQLHYGQAIARYGLKDYEGVITACDSALDISELTYLDEDISMIKAAALSSLGDTESAGKVYSDIIVENEKNTEAYIKRAQNYELAGDTDSAKADYNKAVEIDAGCYEAYFGLYNIYLSIGDEKTAQSVLDAVVSSKRDETDDKAWKGYAYYCMGDYDSADKYLSEAKEGSRKAVYYQGIVLMAKGDYSAALDKLSSFVSDGSASELAQGYNQMAGCHFELKQYEAASECIDKGLELGATSSEKALKKNKIILCEKMGNYKEAKENAKEYVTAYPDDSEMHKELQFIQTRIKTKRLGKKAEKEAAQTTD